MATQTVTISILNGTASVSPDELEVDPNNTVVWQLAAGSTLRWPTLPTPPPNHIPHSIWKHVSGSTIIESLHFVAAVAPSTTPTLQGTVSSTAVPGSVEDYDVGVDNQNPPGGDASASGRQEGTITIDPKIKVKQHK